MTKTLLRAGALSCALLASTALTVPAMAQSGALPRFNQVDANGVDLFTGDFFFSMIEGAIGSGEGSLSLMRNWAGAAGWTDNWSGKLYSTTIGGVVHVFVEFGTYEDDFTLSGGVYTSTKADGATLASAGPGILRYTARDGTSIDYAVEPPPSSSAEQLSCATSVCGFPVQIRRPNGMIYMMNWDVADVCAQFSEGSCNHIHGFYRLAGVASSANYAFTINYATDDPGEDAPPPADWFRRTQVQFTNLDGAPASLPTVTYNQVSPTVLDVTDTGGQTWRLTLSSGRLTGIRRPGAGSDTTAVSYSGAIVTSVTREGVATAYSRFTSGSGGSMTVTDANGGETIAVFSLTTERITSVFDASSQTTGYSYDSSGRLTGISRPEGNAVQYTYDARGNLTQTLSTPKSGSGLANMVTSASYSSTCANPVVCNLPNSTTDARGNVTDYTYDSTHGGLLTVTAPAPASGLDRPQTRYSYGAVTAVTGQPVTLPTAVSACASGTAGGSPSCVGTAAESRTVIAYDSDNLRTTSVTRRNGDNSLSATTAFTYDAIGNTLTADGPIAGTADTTRFRYDSARRAIGVAGPDPDGGGSLKHRAVRTTYTNGLPTSVEQGTVNSQSDGDWAAFSPLQRVEQTYDANARPTVQRLISGSTTYALTQTSYDALGRVRCTVQRMNPAEFASLPSDACTLDTEGSHGPDRITRVSYDPLSRPTLVETGVGTAAEADEVATTYTANGQAATVTDANGNKTTYVYDGHDRLSRTRMPDPSTPGTSSTTDYEELTYLTATVGGSTVSTPLVSGRRLRDGYAFAFAYDALGRLVERDPPELPNVSTDATTVYGYDNLGRLTSAAQASIPHSLAFAWDALGRKVSETGVFGTIAYQYDLAGRRTRLSWPGSALYVDYDHLVTGEVSAIRENGATSGAGVLGAYAYDDLGRRTGLTRGNGATTSWSYDNVSRLTGLSHNLAGTGSDVSFAYAYDPAGGIVSTTRDNDAYAYTGLANANVANTVNGLNQVTATGGSALSHDARGNVTAVPAAASATGAAAGYDYMAENRLVHGPNGSAFGYDPLGRLFVSYSPALGGTYYLMDGQTIVAEIDSGSNVTRRYVPGPGMDEPLVWYEGSGTSTRRYHHADERGSVIAVSDGSGALVGSAPNRYDDYGNAQGTLTGRFGYTGQPWLPEAGLYHYRARDYNPAMGRFMQTDPIGHEGGMNLYAYVGNDPVNRTDPMGLQADCPLTCVTVNYRPQNAPAVHFGNFASIGGLPFQEPDFEALIRRLVFGCDSSNPDNCNISVTARRRSRALSDCQQRFVIRELSARGFPANHVANIRFISGLDANAAYFTRRGYASGASAVTQGNTIYVRPGDYESIANLRDARGFEEIVHSAQFIEAGSPAQFYRQYITSSIGGAVLTGNGYEGNIFEAIAKGAAQRMFEASGSQMCR